MFSHAIFFTDVKKDKENRSLLHRNDCETKRKIFDSWYL